MAEPLIERHLDQVRASLHVRGPYRDRVLAELRSHIEDAADRAEAGGLTREHAERAAIDQLGPVEDLVAGLRPRATRRTRILAGLPAVGLVLVAAANRATNELHEDGGRLGSSIPYTAAYLVAWLSALLIGAPLLAVFVRHRGALGLLGLATAGAVILVIAALLAFNFSNDGTLTRGDPSIWRGLAIATGGLATAALVMVIQRAQLLPRWPLVLLGSGLTLVAAHYLLPGRGGNLAVVGMACIVGAGVAYTVILVRERPLA